MSLFRKEAISHHGQSLTGVITLAQPLSIKLITLILVSITLLILIFLFTAEYTRKETVRGFLIPNKGVIKSFASPGDSIEKLWVNEGDFIKRGQLLVTMVVHQSNASGIDLSEQLIQYLDEQQYLLSNEIMEHQVSQKKERLEHTQRKKTLIQEELALKKQYALVSKKLKILNRQQKQYKKLNQNGFLSNLEKERQRQSILNAEQETYDFTRLLLKNKKELTRITFNIENIPQQYNLRINKLKREDAKIKLQLAQIKNKYRYTIKASHSGIVTSIQVVEGETLNENKPLLTILPEGSELVAELLLPTRSAGFIQLGNYAKLRFDAFPYQRFGFIKSEVSRIDRAIINPNELQLPISIKEPIYRLRAVLSEQQINAYGKSFSLKSGMLFEADIMLEKRSLIEWLLEPLYSLKGKI